MKKLTVHHIQHVPRCLSWGLCVMWIYIYVDVIYKYLCPVCFLSPHNQAGWYIVFDEYKWVIPIMPLRDLSTL